MGKSASVLIVEDTSSIALVFQKWLAKFGLSSQIAETGGDAIEQIDSGKHSVVLLDLELPDMNGLEILEKYDGKEHGVTFVVVTASGSIKIAVDAMRMGAYDFLINRRQRNG